MKLSIFRLDNHGSTTSPKYSFTSNILQLLLILYCSIASAHAATQTIEQQATQFLQQQLQQWAHKHRLQSIRSHITLTTRINDHKHYCQDKIAITSLTNLNQLWGRVSLRITCPKPVWQLSLRGEISAQVYIPVMNKDLFRDDIIQAKDLHWQWHELGFGSNNWITHSYQLIGMRVARHLRAEQAIKTRQVTAPYIIKRGNEVLIMASNDNHQITIKTKGIALANAGLHQSVRVRNSHSGKIITAYSISQGVVQTHY